MLFVEGRRIAVDEQQSGDAPVDLHEHMQRFSQLRGGVAA